MDKDQQGLSESFSCTTRPCRISLDENHSEGVEFCTIHIHIHKSQPPTKPNQKRRSNAFPPSIPPTQANVYSATSKPCMHTSSHTSHPSPIPVAVLENHTARLLLAILRRHARLHRAASLALRARCGRLVRLRAGMCLRPRCGFRWRLWSRSRSGWRLRSKSCPGRRWYGRWLLGAQIGLLDERHALVRCVWVADDGLLACERVVLWKFRNGRSVCSGFLLLGHDALLSSQDGFGPGLDRSGGTCDVLADDLIQNFHPLFLFWR